MCAEGATQDESSNVPALMKVKPGYASPLPAIGDPQREQNVR
jgi:hypothetical protein